MRSPPKSMLAAGCAAVLFGALGSGCGPASEGDGGGTGGAGATGAGGAFDYPHLDTGSWLLEGLATTVNGLYPPAVAHTSDGTSWLVWSEYDGASPYRLWLAHGRPGSWVVEPLEPGGRASLRAHGQELHLAYEGTASGSYDVLYLRFDGETWHGPLNLSAAAGPPGDWPYDAAPEMMVSPAGELAVAYTSQSDFGATEVRVQRIEDDTPVGPPRSVLGTSCYDKRAVLDADGVAHVLATCNSQYVYLDDAEGEFAFATLPPVSLLALPLLELGQNGRTVHFASRGADECDYVGYTRGSGDIYGEPVTLPVCGGITNLRLAVDGFGRALVAFAGEYAGGFGATRVSFSYYEHGAELEPASTVAETSAGGIDVGGISVDPTTGLPLVGLWRYEPTTGGYVVTAASYMP
ncbi:MAG: hypothetical protein HY908_37400 [Myxococcales bacterium]|nr:hypothetical protein [Myxococcales bacterium]